MAVTIQCPNPACAVSSSVADSVAGRGVKCKKCGTPFKATPTLDGQPSDTRKSSPSSSGDPFPTLPAEFGRYRVLKLLGRGGMGAVYLAQDSQLGRSVALKLPSFDVSETKRVERFVREAKAAAGLMHPNICPVFDAGQIEGRPFITMAFIDGTSLEAAIDPDVPMDQARAAGLARKVAAALHEAHEKGIVHRDLKPANVMLSAKGEPVVMDFGLAKRFAEADPHEAKLTRDGAIMGTPSYMAPEQVMGELDRIGPGADVYALGVMLFELLTGQTPYSGALGMVMGQILAAPVRRPSELRPDVDPRLDAACHRAMAKDPADRFPDMAAFGTALDQYFKGPDASSVSLARPATSFEDLGYEPMDEAEAPKKPRRKKQKSASRLPLLIGAGVLACLVMVVVIVLTVRTKHGDVVIDVGDATGVEVKVDGERVQLTGLDKPLTLTAGEHGLTVTGADFETVTQSFTVKKGEKQVVKVTMKVKPDVATPPNAKQPISDQLKPVITDTSPTIRFLASSSLWLGRPPGEIWRSAEHASKILGATYSPSGRHVAVVRDNQQVDIWPINDTQDGRQQYTLTHPVSTKPPLITGVAFSPNGQFLATSGRDGSIKLWSMTPAPAVSVSDLKVTNAIVTALAFSPSGKWFAAASREAGGRVKVWEMTDPAKPRESASFTVPDPDAIASATFSKDSSTLYLGTGNTNGTTRVYSASLDGARAPRVIWANTPNLTATGGVSWTRSLALSNNGHDLGFAAGDKVYIYDLESNKVRLEFAGHSAGLPIVGFSFSPDGARCLSASYDKTIRLWSATTGLELWKNKQSHGYNEGVCFSPDGRLAFSGCKGDAASENIAQLWRLPDAISAQITPPTGFTPLFNGKDLTGWKTHLDQPGGWTVEDGNLVGRGQVAHHLFSERGDFEDFHLRAELKISQQGSSGVFFRSDFNVDRGRRYPTAYEVQFDQNRPQATSGTGSLRLFGGAKKEDPPYQRSNQPAGSWFVLDLIAQGNRLIVKVNGNVTADVIDSDNRFRKGHLVLQALSGEANAVVNFRKIEIKALPKSGDGFVPLFNGKDLTGWNGATELFRVEGNEITTIDAGPSQRGKITTDGTYRNFTFHCEFQLPSTANSGIDLGIRDDGAPGIKINLVGKDFVLVDKNGKTRPTDPKSNLTGTIVPLNFSAPYTRPNPVPVVANPPGWNRLEVTAQDDLLVVTVNDTEILRKKFEDFATEDKDRAALRSRKPGKIGIEAFTGSVRFRNVRIKDLDATPSTDNYIPIFNGKDLTGWTGLPDHWRVNNGMIVGSSPKEKPETTTLATTRTYKDFELRLSVRLTNGVGNPGIKFRSSKMAGDRSVFRGPTVGVGPGHWGSRVGSGPSAFTIHSAADAAAVREAVKPNDFNDYVIRVVGKRLTVRINGNVVFDAEQDSLGEEGVIGLQLSHIAPPDEVSFRDISVRDLTADKLSVAPLGKPELVTLSELPKDHFIWSLWVSPDGLTLYWNTKGNNATWVWTATRKDRDAPFENHRRLFPGSNCSASDNGLRLMVLTSESRRASTDANWGPLVETGSADTKGIMRSVLVGDGRQLIGVKPATGKNEGLEKLRFRRAGLDAPWGKPEPLVTTGLPDNHLDFLFMTADEKLLFGTPSSESGLNALLVLESNDGGKSFGEPRTITIPPNGPAVPIFPRYCAATKELFFGEAVKDADRSKIYVIRNFDIERDSSPLVEAGKTNPPPPGKP